MIVRGRKGFGWAVARPKRYFPQSRFVGGVVNNRTVLPSEASPLKWRFAACAGLLFFLARGPAFAADDSDTQYRFDTWRAEQGLPQNTVKVITQTQDGYLWFGTRFGIVRFDGVTLRAFDRVKTQGLAYDNCISIAEEQDGTVWFATPYGAASYRDGTFTTHTLGQGKGEDRVYAICAARQGGIWIAAAGGLHHLKNGLFTRYPLDEPERVTPVFSVLEDRDGTLWAGTTEGLQRRDPAGGKFVVAWSPNDATNNRVQCIFKDRAGNLWIGTEGAGLQRWKNGNWTGFTTRDGLTENRVDVVTDDHEGNIWIVSGKGELVRFRNGKFTPFGRKEELSEDVVLCAHEDHEGNLWVGTVYGGLKRMQPRRILAYSTHDGLGHNDVWSICESRDGGLWIGTAAGISLFRDGKFVNYSLEKELRDPRVKSVFEDKAGNLWIGAMMAGLLRRSANGKLTAYTEKDGLANYQVNAISEDREGSIWIGTVEGLNRFKDGLLTTYTTKNGLAANDVRVIHQDRSGDLWIGTYGGGLSRFHDGRFTPLTTREGLSDNFAWCVYEDKEGTLWIGTENGLNRLKDGRVSWFKKDQGLFDNVVNDILEDKQGNLWISCNRGIYRVAKAQLNAVAEGATNAVEYVSYGISDGMLSSETNGENQPAACKTRDGRLWFPTTDGVVMIDPDKITHNDVRPPVVIEETLMDRLSLNPNRPARLEPGRGGVFEVHYTANSLVAPEKVRFKFCLDGCDKSWIEAGSRRVAYYTNLRPGNYTFRVIACNNHGVWNNQGTSFAFYLAPHFYQTWPFYALCGLLVVLIGYSMHWIRLGVVRKIERLEKQHALEMERARIAGEMHDDLGSSLTQIALLGELAHRDISHADRAGDHLRKILTTTREVFRAMDEIVWAVNPKHDTLSSLVGYLSKYAQDFLRPAGIRCRFDLPASVPPYPLTTEVRHNLFLTVKEALNNIAKHAAASEVWLRLSLDTTRCRLTLEDNGRGFPPGSTRPGGNGLSNMKERLAAIGGEFNLDSRPGSGTKLELIVPLKPDQQNASNQAK